MHWDALLPLNLEVSHPPAVLRTASLAAWRLLLGLCAESWQSGWGTTAWPGKMS